MGTGIRSRPKEPMEKMEQMERMVVTVRMELTEPMDKTVRMASLQNSRSRTTIGSYRMTMAQLGLNWVKPLERMEQMVLMAIQYLRA